MRCHVNSSAHSRLRPLQITSAISQPLVTSSRANFTSTKAIIKSWSQEICLSIYRTLRPAYRHHLLLRAASDNCLRFSTEDAYTLPWMRKSKGRQHLWWQGTENMANSGFCRAVLDFTSRRIDTEFISMSLPSMTPVRTVSCLAKMTVACMPQWTSSRIRQQARELSARQKLMHHALWSFS